VARLADFDYDLPEELIAQFPARRREDARLLRIDRATGEITHGLFVDFPELLRPGDCLVLNDTQVFPARLVGVRPTRGKAEALLIRQQADGTWQALCKPVARLRPGTEIDFDPSGRRRLVGTVVSRMAEGLCRLRLCHDEPLPGLLDELGRVPLPPYIGRDPVSDIDRERYQTVYARSPGSAAAPTAGLHFSHATLSAIRERGVAVCALTLDIGPGTFRPVTAERIEDHIMHSEAFVLPQQTAEQINAAKAAGGRVVAVGTTSMRTLEAVAGPDGTVEAAAGETDLFITPGYEFRCVDALLTNFHLPRSTLLMLVHAFAGCDLGREAYAEAVARRYRFYSYGDAMFVA